MSALVEQLMTKKSEVLSLLLEHVQPTVVAVLVAVVVGILLDIFITKNKKLASGVIEFADLAQVIPSLAILDFLISVVGIGSTPAIAMMVLYSILPIIKNTCTGTTDINPDMLKAAKGLDMTSGQTLKLIEIPLAMPATVAGIRMATVTAAGLMTIVAFVGAGGLGYLVFSGIQTVDNNLILSGMIPATILALVIDWITGKIKAATMPNRIRKSDGTMEVKRNSSDKNKKRNIIIASVLVIIVIGEVMGTSIVSRNEKGITVTSGNYTEQLTIGSILSKLVKANTDIKVEEKFSLGGSQATFDALKSGAADVHVEYLEIGYVNIPNISEPNSNREGVYNIVQERFKNDYNIKSLNPLGFNDTYAVAITKETAERYNLETVSDLAKIAGDLAIGPTVEFPSREDGLIGLEKAYNVGFKQVKPVDGGLRCTTLVNNETQVIDAFITDGLINKFQLVVLENDKEFFPPYGAVPIIKKDTLKEFPELKNILGKLDRKLTEGKMRKLNYEVGINKRNVETIATEFLKPEGLIE